MQGIDIFQTWGTTIDSMFSISHSILGVSNDPIRGRYKEMTVKQLMAQLEKTNKAAVRKYGMIRTGGLRENPPKTMTCVNTHMGICKCWAYVNTHSLYYPK